MRPSPSISAVLQPRLRVDPFRHASGTSIPLRAEDYCKADNTLSVGPGYLLPKKRNPETGSYEGFDYVSPPKDPAESLRRNKEDLIDLKDRRACLAKPAGVGSAGSVGQSGISKQLDAHTGHKLLSSIAKSLAKAERFLAEYALMVLRDKAVTPDERATIKVGYPSRFDLHGAADLIDGTSRLQVVLAACGNAPNTERELIQEQSASFCSGWATKNIGRSTTRSSFWSRPRASCRSGTATCRTRCR